MRKILIIFALFIVGCNQQQTQQTLGEKLKACSKNGTIVPQNPLPEVVLDKIQLFIYEQQIDQENIQVLLHLLEIDPNNAIFLKGYKQSFQNGLLEFLQNVGQAANAGFEATNSTNSDWLKRQMTYDRLERQQQQMKLDRFLRQQEHRYNQQNQEYWQDWSQRFQP